MKENTKITKVFQVLLWAASQPEYQEIENQRRFLRKLKKRLDRCTLEELNNIHKKLMGE